MLDRNQLSKHFSIDFNAKSFSLEDEGGANNCMSIKTNFNDIKKIENKFSQLKQPKLQGDIDDNKLEDEVDIDKVENHSKKVRRIFIKQ